MPRLSHFLLLLCCLFAPFSLQAAPPEKTGEVLIIALTDYHGALLEQGKHVGLAKLLSAVKAHRAAHPASVLVAVGDLFAGTPESNLLEGRPVLEGLQLAGLDCSAMGNHECDWGRQPLRRWQEAGLRLLSANARMKDGASPSWCRPWRMVEAGGLKVAFIGLTTTATSRISRGATDLLFLSPEKTLEEVVPQVRALGADAVVVLAHLASRRGAALDDIPPGVARLAQVPGVTAVIYGHSHETHLARVDNVPVVQPTSHGGGLALLTLRRDASVPGGVAAEAALDNLAARKDAIIPDPEGQALIRRVAVELGPLLDGEVGVSTDALPLDYATPSLLGQLVGDALRFVSGAEVAVVNGGVLRAALPKGNIIERNLYSLLPFDNTLVVLRLTGKQIREVLEFGLGNPHLRRSVQMSGWNGVYDMRRPFRDRLVRLERADGGPADPEALYTVVVSMFLAEGGDKFPHLAQAERLKELPLSERDALRRYFQARTPLTPPRRLSLSPAK